MISWAAPALFALHDHRLCPSAPSRQVNRRLQSLAPLERNRPELSTSCSRLPVLPSQVPPQASRLTDDWAKTRLGIDTKRQQQDQRSGRSTGLAEAASRESLGAMVSLPVEAVDAAYFLKNAPCNAVLMADVSVRQDLPSVTGQRPLRAVGERTPGDRPNASKDIYVQVRRPNVQAHGQVASVHQERRREHV